MVERRAELDEFVADALLVSGALLVNRIVQAEDSGSGSWLNHEIVNEVRIDDNTIAPGDFLRTEEFNLLVRGDISSSVLT